MPEKTANNLKTAGILVGLFLAIVSPIVAVTKVNTSNAVKTEYVANQARTANAKAEEAKSIAEKNARDFEYFKGEMSATMKAQKDSLDKVDNKIDKVEGKVDEMLKIIVRFERADDGK